MVSPRLPGHVLVAGGAPHTTDGEQIRNPGVGDLGGPGRGKCSCGEISHWVGSHAARRVWHTQHKQEVREQQ